MRIKCGDCEEAVVICYEFEPLEHSSQLLEIGGVMGTIDQWRTVFAPLLGFHERRVRESGRGSIAVWDSFIRD